MLYIFQYAAMLNLHWGILDFWSTQKKSTCCQGLSKVSQFRSNRRICSFWDYI